MFSITAYPTMAARKSARAIVEPSSTVKVPVKQKFSRDRQNILLKTRTPFPTHFNATHLIPQILPNFLFISILGSQTVFLV